MHAEVQAFLFDIRDGWNTRNCRQWLSKAGYSLIGIPELIDTTYLKYHIQREQRYRVLYLRNVAEGIKMITGLPFE